MIWPLILVLLSIPILGQKIRWFSMAAMLISFSGALLIATQGTFFSGQGVQIKNPVGVVLAASSAFLWALYFLLNMKNNLPDDLSFFLIFYLPHIYIPFRGHFMACRRICPRWRRIGARTKEYPFGRVCGAF
jgi:drug/metabolite transporter (DMT)-like permease